MLKKKVSASAQKQKPKKKKKKKEQKINLYNISKATGMTWYCILIYTKNKIYKW